MYILLASLSTACPLCASQSNHTSVSRNSFGRLSICTLLCNDYAGLPLVTEVVIPVTCQ